MEWCQLWPRQNKFKKSSVCTTKTLTLFLKEKYQQPKQMQSVLDVENETLAITNREFWLRQVGTKNNVADGLTKTMNQHVLRNMLTTLKIELLETSKEQLSMNLIVCKNMLMGAEDLDAGHSGRQSKCWTQEHRDGLPRKSQEHRDGLLRKSQEHRDGLPRKLQEHRDGLPRKLQEHRDGLRRKSQEHRDGLPRTLQEHCDGLPRKREHHDGWPRKLHKKIMMDGRENWHKKIMMDGRENWHKKIVTDCRENWHKKIVMDGRENWHKKIVMDGRENWHKKIVMDGRENWHKKIVMDGAEKIGTRKT